MYAGYSELLYHVCWIQWVTV
jgi:hypothetical protein